MSRATVHATRAELTKCCPHAVTVRCPAGALWPWLAQMGADRGGWYGYDVIDNGGRPSAEEILPQFQHVERGDVFPWLPGATDGFVVWSVKPGLHLVVVKRIVPAGHYVMERRQLLGIARRAEHRAKERPPQLSTTLL
jgi:hypothetical protein